MSNKSKIEICANSVESAVKAQQAGAYRVELCAGIPEGGTTPSFGEIRMARQLLNQTKLHVIIRPRGGDFLYIFIVNVYLEGKEMARRKFEPGRNGESRIVEIPSSTNGVCENKLFYAHRLKELRTIAHLTQADLANALGLLRSEPSLLPYMPP